MKKYLLILMILLLVGCSQEAAIDMQTPFIGGTTGVVSDFVDFRAEVYDKGTDTFDIVMKVENQGETELKKENIRVKLSGVNPAEFGKSSAQMISHPLDDVIPIRKDIQGNVILSSPVFVEFKDLKYLGDITGVSATFPLRADVCYLYGTQTVSKFCVRENILTPRANGICEVNEDKPFFNSAAPVQITRVTESGRAKDKIGFSFEVRNVGLGDVFVPGSTCDRLERKNMNKVFVKVNTNIPGIECTSLESKGIYADGIVTLFDGAKIITCTQPVISATDFEQVFSIETGYDYEEFKQTEIVVKSSEAI